MRERVRAVLRGEPHDRVPLMQYEGLLPRDEVETVFAGAKGEPATVTIKDWQNEKEPGGPVGQELMLNFAEMHPYYGEEQQQ